MRSNKNIEEFFKKRLENDSPASDEWNIPSDDIWNNAKASFPKEKKKNRGLLPFIFGTGILLIASFLIFNSLADQNKIESKDFRKKESTASFSPNLENEKLNGSVQEKELNPETNDESESLKQTKTAESPAIKNKIEKSEISIESLSQKTNVPESTQTFQSKEEVVIFRTEDSKLNMESTETSPRLNQTPVETQKTNNFKLEKLNSLAVLSIEELEKEKDEFEERILVKKSQFSPPISKWEIGIAHAPFILPFRFLNGRNLVSDSDTFKINIKYKSANIYINRRLNHRWSLSSGLMLTDAEIKAQFTELRNNPDGATFRLSSDINLGSINVNGTERQINANYIEGKEPQVGDEILLDACMPLKLNAIQIPLLINYHFDRKHNREWSLHSGISLDFLRARINEFGLQIYNNNELISNPIEDFQAIDVRVLDFSFYLGGGFKYHLNENWNIGINARLDVFALPLSRYDVGAYYRF